MRHQERNGDDWAASGAVALKVATLLTVVAVIALGAGVGNHDHVTAASTTTSSAASVEEKPYYMPSEYELKAPAQEGEPAPTF